MRIPRTNFPIKADEYEFESQTGEELIRPLVPLARPVDLANANSTALYESVVVKRPTTPPGSQRPVPVTKPAPAQSWGKFDADASSAPISKRMFSLSENVRFTRTPDSELLKSKDPAPNEAAGAPKAAMDEKRSAAGNSLTKPDATITPRRVRDLAPEGSLLFGQAIPADPLAVAVPHAPALAKVVTETKAPSSNDSPLAYVSDYAFFESADFIGGIAPVAAATPVKPMPRFSPDEITARFRVVEYNKPRPLGEAPKSQLASPPLDPAPIEHHQPEKPSPEQRLERVDIVDVGSNAIPEPVSAVTPQRTITRRRDIAPVQSPLPPRQIAVAGPVEPRIFPIQHGTYENLP